MFKQFEKHDRKKIYTFYKFIFFTNVKKKYISCLIYTNNVLIKQYAISNIANGTFGTFNYCNCGRRVGKKYILLNYFCGTNWLKGTVK